MITTNDLTLLSKSNLKEYPILDIPNLKERLNEIYKLYGFDLIDFEISKETIHDLYLNNKYDGSITDIRHLKAFYKFFTLEETMKIIHSSPYSLHMNVKNDIEEDKSLNWIKTIKLSLWQNSYTTNWNDICDFNNKCISFNPFSDNEDIDIVFDHAQYPENPWGTAKYNRTYMDARVGFILRYKGINSFMISLDVLEDKILHIKQIQSLIPKRNKLRFKLGNDFFEKIANEFISHFNNYDVFLITGEGMEVQMNILHKDIEEVPKNVRERIFSTYNQKFKNLITKEIIKTNKNIGRLDSKEFSFRLLKKAS